MDDRNKMASYYSCAREFVERNDSEAARKYVLVMMNIEFENYNRAKTILSKAQSSARLDQWIAVSRELRTKGITDYVLKCFNLPTKEEQMLPKLQPNHEQQVAPKGAPKGGQNTPSPKTRSKEETLPKGGVDISGLIADTPKSQTENSDEWATTLFEKNKRAVVEICSSNSRLSKCGTGFIISKNGYLLTNHHVIFDDKADAYCTSIVMSFAGKKEKYKLEIESSDKKYDVALCSFQPEKVKNFDVVKRISDYSQVKQGNKCLVMGNPFGEGLSPFTGEIRYSKNREGNLVYSGNTNSGDSGGPVFNVNGECIGINKSKTVAINSEPVSGFSNATPMDKINELLEKWCANNEIIL